LWVATAEYWKDVNIGPATLSTVAESLRKIRNSARFALANVRPTGSLYKELKVPREALGLVRTSLSTFKNRHQLSQMERYMMHKLYHLEATALEGYRTFNFAKGM
jgi:isoleucyl-tRNA synthetase